MSNEKTMNDATAKQGCCGGSTSTTSVQPKVHAHPHGHHSHSHAHAHGDHPHPHDAKSEAGCCATEAKETTEACCAEAEAPQPVAVKAEKKADGGGCCSR